MSSSRPRVRDPHQRRDQRHGSLRVLPPPGLHIDSSARTSDGQAPGPPVSDLHRLNKPVPGLKNARERFDHTAVRLMNAIEERWADRLCFVDLCVEDIPVLPGNYDQRHSPLSSLVLGDGQTPPKIVLFRRPIELRADDQAELVALIFTCLVEQVSGFLQIPPGEVHPGFTDD